MVECSYPHAQNRAQRWEGRGGGRLGRGGALIGGRATLSVGCRKPRPAGDDGGLGPEDDDSETGGSFPGTGGAEFWHPPKRPGRQLTQVFPSFTQLHFLQMPERLQRQHGIIGQAPSPSPPRFKLAGLLNSVKQLTARYT